MITKHKDIYYKNKYGYRFPTEKAALEDEVRRDSANFKITKIISSWDWFGLPCVEALDDTKEPFIGQPFIGQPNGKSNVILLKDIVHKMQGLIFDWGDNIGLCEHHCGMGNYCEELVLIEKIK